MDGAMDRRDRALLVAWPVVLAAVICGPLLAPGFVLGYDMVFVPDLAVRADLFGGATALPRAVPSDAVVAMLDELTGGMVLNKAVLLAVPLGAGWGMVALMRVLWPSGGTAGCVVAATFYVWNAYVAERLALGHWALLIGYAALPWLARSVILVRHGHSTAWAGAVVSLAACALTASGGLIGLLVAAAVLLWPSARSGARKGHGWGRRTGLAVLVAGVLLNAPWMAAGLARGANAVSDPAAVAAFAPRDEGYGGVLPTLLTLGGIWNGEVVPHSRGTSVAVAGGLLVLLASSAGVALWWRRDRSTAGPVTLAAAGVVVVALLGVLAPRFVAWLVASVPGAGLVRDGSRYLGPLALLEAAGLGWAAGWTVSWLTGHAVRRGGRWIGFVTAATAVLLPIAVLPELAWGGGLTRAQYPSDWPAARAVVAADPRPGDLMPWPFESYRAPAWQGGRPVLDPVPRYFSRPAVVPDELVVSGRRLAGEDLRAAAIAAAIRSGGDATGVVLGQGVGWIVVDREAAARAGQPDPARVVRAAVPVFEGPTIAVYTVGGQPARRPAMTAGGALAVVAGWLSAGGVLLAAVTVLAGRGRHAFRERGGPGGRPPDEPE